jgi:hypothetical protein
VWVRAEAGRIREQQSWMGIGSALEIEGTAPSPQFTCVVWGRESEEGSEMERQGVRARLQQAVSWYTELQGHLMCHISQFRSCV